MTVSEWATAMLLLGAAFFFAAGTVGILRFPDVHSRLHAITKADNLGLGLVVAGLLLQVESLAVAMKLIPIWSVALFSSATSCYLIANSAGRNRSTE